MSTSTPFDPGKRLLLVGDVFVDVHLQSKLIRLGGVFHAARAAHAIGAGYGVAYLAPSYLVAEIDHFLSKLGCQAFAHVGEITGSPSVMLIGDSAEAGDVGYDGILRAARQCVWKKDELRDLVERFRPTDTLVLAGDYPLQDVLDLSRSTGAAIHLDCEHQSKIDLQAFGAPIETIFVSTSSQIFADLDRDAGRVVAALQPHAHTLVLKENRGGSRGLSIAGVVDAPSFPTETAHSVGVGDCFDAILVAAYPAENLGLRMRRASYYASMYATTFSHDSFVDDVTNARRLEGEIATLRGVRLPWERRRDLHVYLAAPDFPHVRTDALDALERALRYHNFTPHRPVRENGISSAQSSAAQETQLYRADIELLEQCALLIAVPLTPDPGTFAELGWATSKNLPTILFDATETVTNLFARRCAQRICKTLSDVIDSTFELMNGLT